MKGTKQTDLFDVNHPAGVYLLYCPQIGNETMYSILLANYSNHAFTCQYQFFCSGINTESIRMQNEPNSLYYLHDMEWDQLNDSVKTVLEIKGETRFTKEIKLRVKGFIKSRKYSPLVSQEAHSYEVFTDFPEQQEIDFSPLYNIATEQRMEKDVDDFKKQFAFVGAEVIIDLHIEELLDDVSSIPDHEKLNFQLDYFERCLDESLQNHLHRLIVIHGVGKGVLKSKIHQLLQQYDFIDSFSNEYHPKFGYGATEIIFR